MHDNEPPVKEAFTESQYNWALWMERKILLLEGELSKYKIQNETLSVDNRLLSERVSSYQRLKQINDISRPSNEA